MSVAICTQLARIAMPVPHVAELTALEGISKAGSGAGAGQSIWPLPFTTENFSGVTPLDVSDADESDDCVP